MFEAPPRAPKREEVFDAPQEPESAPFSSRPLPEEAMPAPSRRPPTAATVGALLAQTRASFGQEVEEVSSALRIRPVFLRAIEEGRHHDLPGLTYGVGFVRSYAHYLGLDVDDCVDRFKEEAAGINRSPNLVFPAPVQEGKVPTGAIILVSLLLVGLAYLVWTYVSRDAEPPAAPLAVNEAPAEPEAAASSGAQLLAAAPASSEAETATSDTTSAAGGEIAAAATSGAAAAAAEGGAGTGDAAGGGGDGSAGSGEGASLAAVPETSQGIVFSEAASTLQPTEIAPDGDSGVQTAAAPSGPRVVLQASQDSWVQIRDASNNSIFTRVLRAGDSYDVPDQPGLTLLTGNAGGLDIIVDGEEIPKLGRSGQVRRNVSLNPASLKAN